MTAAQIAYWDDVFAKTVATAEWKQELERSQLEQHYLDPAHAAFSTPSTAHRRHHEEDLLANAPQQIATLPRARRWGGGHTA
jgi:hypothetical protein